MDEDKKPRFIQMPNSNLMDKSAIDAAYFKKEVPDSRVIYSKVMWPSIHPKYLNWFKLHQNLQAFSLEIPSQLGKSEGIGAEEMV